MADDRYENGDQTFSVRVLAQRINAQGQHILSAQKSSDSAHERLDLFEERLDARLRKVENDVSSIKTGLRILGITLLTLSPIVSAVLVKVIS